MNHSGKSCKLKFIFCSVHTFTVNQKAEKMFQADKIYMKMKNPEIELTACFTTRQY